MGVNALPDQQSPGRYPENCCKLWGFCGIQLWASTTEATVLPRLCRAFASEPRLVRNKNATAPTAAVGFLCSRLSMEVIIRTVVRFVKGIGRMETLATGPSAPASARIFHGGNAIWMLNWS